MQCAAQVQHKFSDIALTSFEAALFRESGIDAMGRMVLLEVTFLLVEQQAILDESHHFRRNDSCRAMIIGTDSWVTAAVTIFGDGCAGDMQPLGNLPLTQFFDEVQLSDFFVDICRNNHLFCIPFVKRFSSIIGRF